MTRASVRNNASKAIRTVVHHEPRQPLIYPELALFDSNEAVRKRAISALEALGASSRVSSLVQRGCQHSDPRIRSACIKMLPKHMSEEETRDICYELLRRERDEGVII